MITFLICVLHLDVPCSVPFRSVVICCVVLCCVVLCCVQSFDYVMCFTHCVFLCWHNYTLRYSVLWCGVV